MVEGCSPDKGGHPQKKSRSGFGPGRKNTFTFTTGGVKLRLGWFRGLLAWGFRGNGIKARSPPCFLFKYESRVEEQLWMIQFELITPKVDGRARISIASFSY